MGVEDKTKEEWEEEEEGSNGRWKEEWGGGREGMVDGRRTWGEGGKKW